MDEPPERALQGKYVFLAMFYMPDAVRPEWYQSVREATSEEDARGFDHFVRLDIGEVPIQIKSSDRDVRRYRRNHPDVEVMIVRIFDHATPEEIRRETLEALEGWRADELRMRAESLRAMRDWRASWTPILGGWLPRTA